MKSKPVIPRQLANRDVDEAFLHCLNENAEQAALGFIEVLEQAYAHIGRHHATGSPQYGGVLE
jgi:toxin ParE1/3/4